MIATNIDQSEKLIKLGININTADMYWDYDTQKHKYHLMVMDEQFDDTCVYAWSLTALLSIIKPVNDNTYTLKGTLDGGAMISFDEVTNVMFQEEEIIDAVFEMVVWLKESKKI